MKKLFILAALFLSLQSFAQITLVETDFPIDGDSRVVSILNDLGSFDFVSTGANYTWDFSQMVPQSQDTIAFISASNTSLPLTYIAAFNNSFTDPEHDADVANKQDYENPVPNVTIEDFYAFYKIQSDAFIQVGAGLTINSAPLPVLFNPMDTIVMLPAAFGDIDTCFSSFSADVPTLGYYSEQRTRFNSIDGWGTLITPFGTFDALRISSYSEIHDSLYYDAYGMGFPMDRTETEYKWYAKNHPIPVLHVIIRDGMSASSTVTYIDSLRNLSLSEQQNINISMHPNPASDVVYFDVEENCFPLDMVIFDMAGREVLSGEISDNRIDVSGLPKGMYCISLTGSGIRAVSRLLVE
ncbi:MAG: T9SS type A sorting domain-containing protein [Bacteroidales bacterium]